MSQAYGGYHWEVTYSGIYRRPEAFTDYCEDPSRKPNFVPKRPCPYTCVTLMQKIEIGRGPIRLLF